MFTPILQFVHLIRRIRDKLAGRADLFQGGEHHRKTWEIVVQWWAIRTAFYCGIYRKSREP